MLPQRASVDSALPFAFISKGHPPFGQAHPLLALPKLSESASEDIWYRKRRLVSDRVTDRGTLAQSALILHEAKLIDLVPQVVSSAHRLEQEVNHCFSRWAGQVNCNDVIRLQRKALYETHFPDRALARWVALMLRDEYVDETYCKNWLAGDLEAPLIWSSVAGYLAHKYIDSTSESANKIAIGCTTNLNTIGIEIEYLAFEIDTTGLRYESEMAARLLVNCLSRVFEHIGSPSNQINAFSMYMEEFFGDIDTIDETLVAHGIDDYSIDAAKFNDVYETLDLQQSVHMIDSYDAYQEFKDKKTAMAVCTDIWREVESCETIPDLPENSDPIERAVYDLSLRYLRIFEQHIGTHQYSCCSIPVTPIITDEISLFHEEYQIEFEGYMANAEPSYEISIEHSPKAVIEFIEMLALANKAISELFELTTGA